MAAVLLPFSAMAHVVRVYEDVPLALTDGRVYIAQSSGRQRDDGTWEGWVEFVPDDGSQVLRTQRETTQPNLGALEYWAAGLTRIYLKGALERVLTPAPVVTQSPAIPAAYDGPAPPKTSLVDTTPAAEPDPVLDPFSVYAKGENVLRRQLAALSPRHLRAIVVAYELAEPADVDLDALTSTDLIELIVAAVRERLAA
jgi:hypothetical protein